MRRAGAGHCAVSTVRPRMRSAAFSAIIITGAFVLPLTIVGMTDASTMRNPSTPCTRRRASTTAMSSLPILQVPAGCQVVEALRLHEGLDLRVASRVNTGRDLLTTDVVERAGVKNAQIPTHAGHGASKVVRLAQIIEVDERPIERIAGGERDLAAARGPTNIRGESQTMSFGHAGFRIIGSRASSERTIAIQG